MPPTTSTTSWPNTTSSAPRPKWPRAGTVHARRRPIQPPVPYPARRQGAPRTSRPRPCHTPPRPTRSGRNSIPPTAGTAAAPSSRSVSQSIPSHPTTKPSSATPRASSASTPARRASPSRTTILTPSAAATPAPSQKVANPENSLHSRPTMRCTGIAF